MYRNLQTKVTNASVENIKETGSFKGAYYELPKRLLTDAEKCREND